MTATRLMIAAAFVATTTGSVTTVAAQSGCAYDTQCKGERICVKGACVSPTVPKDFPPTSSDHELGGRRVIKTTREDCETRGGAHQPTNDPKEGNLVRCALPRQ